MLIKEISPITNVVPIFSDNQYKDIKFEIKPIKKPKTIPSNEDELNKIMINGTKANHAKKPKFNGWNDNPIKTEDKIDNLILFLLLITLCCQEMFEELLMQLLNQLKICF